MFQRFVAATAIGALLIAVAAFVLVFIPGMAMSRMWPLTTLWCFLPLAWGIWALLTPRTWMADRLPYWGAILGFLGGTTGAFVLNIPSRIFQEPVSVAGRSVAVVFIAVAYYFFWMLVRVAYRSLVAEPAEVRSIGGSQMKKAA